MQKTQPGNSARPTLFYRIHEHYNNIVSQVTGHCWGYRDTYPWGNEQWGVNIPYSPPLSGVKKDTNVCIYRQSETSRPLKRYIPFTTVIGPVFGTKKEKREKIAAKENITAKNVSECSMIRIAFVTGGNLYLGIINTQYRTLIIQINTNKVFLQIVHY
ncbi:hypothetical protein JTE90_021919 [Oedothorax gibbosus]|uniref:Uncharacterized protein n=1 Tax=Oedothorax gibbosus TaxID=931172 RepID=A0AAV6VWZ3_9ARAC|nr:hypothetical protein JTE90_021919 [Oedothorax gibbosus]